MVKIFSHKNGFTMIELLVVIAILGIISTVALANFHSSMIKSRDAKRKSDLEQIQRALEMYYNDAEAYPNSTAAGGTISSFTWGAEFKDANNTVYMKEIPKDPIQNPDYCYKSVAAPAKATSYQLYAKLENIQDPKATLIITCNGIDGYNFGVSSTNTSP